THNDERNELLASGVAWHAEHTRLSDPIEPEQHGFNFSGIDLSASNVDQGGHASRQNQPALRVGVSHVSSEKSIVSKGRRFAGRSHASGVTGCDRTTVDEDSTSRALGSKARGNKRDIGLRQGGAYMQRLGDIFGSVVRDASGLAASVKRVHFVSEIFMEPADRGRIDSRAGSD